MRAIRRLALQVLLFLGTAVPAWCTWNEFPVTGDAPVTSCGAYDSVWKLFWYVSTSSKLYAVYNNGGVWTSQVIATNAKSYNNSVAVDSTYHWTYYTGTDDCVYVAYWTGSAWTSIKVGQNANDAHQTCVDSVWHNCYYSDGNGFLWVIYWNGSNWIETQLDQTISRSGLLRTCGVDEVWHLVWNISNQRKLVYTQWTGSAWVTGTLSGTGLDLSPTSLFYYGISVDSSTHLVYALQVNMGNAPQQVSAAYYNGSAWVATPVMQDGNLSATNTPTACLLHSPQPYACFVGTLDSSSNARCLFTGYSSTGRMWTTGRADNASLGGGLGLYPLAVGYNGQAVLCTSGSGTVKVLMSDTP